MGDFSRPGWLLRLRERGVIRVAASYAVIAWLLLQIADVIFEPLGVPRWVMVALIVTAALGFPAAVAFAWIYEAGDAGLARDTAADGVRRPVVHGVRRYADVAIIGVLLVAVAVLLVRQSDFGPSAARPAIAVLPFENLGAEADGKVIAVGIAESVLYQLANLAQLDVISRTSSFALGDRNENAQEIGRKLGARYLLEGSVQSDRSRMRVTARLIDATTGADVWAMRFERPPDDIFAVQDEIAVQVAQALELSIDPAARERMTGQGTTNLAAYLAFLQGRSLLATLQLDAAKEAAELFGRSVKLDPEFASGYVSLAEAVLFVGEYEVTPDRDSTFEAALRRGQELVDRALAIDPGNGDAILQRAHMTAFVDLSAAEADYRRGLELKPNAAKGYVGLAAVVYEDPARRDEALELIDRARRLDPLEPANDVTKALFLNWERGDRDGAEALLLDVVKRHPRYQPALARLGQVRRTKGQTASAIRYLEQALANDPAQELTRRVLISAYVDLGDLSDARELVDDDGLELPMRQLKLLMRRGAWRDAGEIAYRALAEDSLLSEMEGPMSVAAIRMQARASGGYERARAALEEASGVRWDANGHAVLPPERSPLGAAIGLADVLMASGDEVRGRELLAAILGRMRYETTELGRPELWYFTWYPAALAMYGEHGAAIAMIERSVANGIAYEDWWWYFELEPAYAPLRREPKFQTTLSAVRAHVEEQRVELDRLRAEGVVPKRGESASRPDGP